MTGGIISEIAACIQEDCFTYLDAPIKRVASLDTPIPLAPDLEKNYLAQSRLSQAIVDLYQY
jgi:2-oxoisovalerate dehydrogenase E1 component